MQKYFAKISNIRFQFDQFDIFCKIFLQFDIFCKISSLEDCLEALEYR